MPKAKSSAPSKVKWSQYAFDECGNISESSSFHVIGSSHTASPKPPSPQLQQQQQQQHSSPIPPSPYARPHKRQLSTPDVRRTSLPNLMQQGGPQRRFSQPIVSSPLNNGVTTTIPPGAVAMTVQQQQQQQAGTGALPSLEALGLHNALPTTTTPLQTQSSSSPLIQHQQHQKALRRVSRSSSISSDSDLEPVGFQPTSPPLPLQFGDPGQQHQQQYYVVPQQHQQPQYSPEMVSELITRLKTVEERCKVLERENGVLRRSVEQVHGVGGGIVTRQGYGMVPAPHTQQAQPQVHTEAAQQQQQQGWREDLQAVAGVGVRREAWV